MCLWELMSGVMCHRRIGKGRKYFMGKMMGSDIIPCEPLCSAGAVCCQGTRPRISLVPFDWKIHLIRLIRTKTCIALYRIHDSMTRGVESDVCVFFFHLCLCAVYSQGWMCEFVKATTLLCLPAFRAALATSTVSVKNTKQRLSTMLLMMSPFQWRTNTKSPSEELQGVGLFLSLLAGQNSDT